MALLQGFTAQWRTRLKVASSTPTPNAEYKVVYQACYMNSKSLGIIMVNCSVPWARGIVEKDPDISGLGV